MKKKRFYYAIVSFMRQDSPSICSRYGTTTKVEGEESEDDVKFYPLMNLIEGAEEFFKEQAIAKTLMVESVIEISEKDYESFNERCRKFDQLVTK